MRINKQGNRSNMEYLWSWHKGYVIEIGDEQWLIQDIDLDKVCTLKLLNHPDWDIEIIEFDISEEKAFVGQKKYLEWLDKFVDTRWQ